MQTIYVTGVQYCENSTQTSAVKQACSQVDKKLKQTVG